MEKHYQFSDYEFENQFRQCTFDPEYFSHEAHLRLAWIHIKKYGIQQAIENVSTQLLNFVDTLGAKDKFNKTLTVASLKAVHHFIQKSNTNSFSVFIETFPRLKFNLKELLSQHYQIDIFNDQLAKQHYLEPDLLPFD